jgi:hypothetical protein
MAVWNKGQSLSWRQRSPLVWQRMVVGQSLSDVQARPLRPQVPIDRWVGHFGCGQSASRLHDPPLCEQRPSPWGQSLSRVHKLRLSAEQCPLRQSRVD